jgi:hypothetical protein
VRFLVILATSVMLTLCPALCGAEVFGHGLFGADDCMEDCGGPATPDPCSEAECQDCICWGAVQPEGVCLQAADGPGVPLSLASADLNHSYLPGHHNRDDAPIGLSALGNSRAVRSFLQNYRC